MSKITNDVLTRSGRHRMVYKCTHMATVGVKWLQLQVRAPPCAICYCISVSLHCVQKKTPTHIFFRISMSDV